MSKMVYVIVDGKEALVDDDGRFLTFDDPEEAATEAERRGLDRGNVHLMELVTLNLSEGGLCPTPGCPGVIDLVPPSDGGCSCHISPPCGHCVDTYVGCSECEYVCD